MLKVLLYGLATFMETGIGVWIFSQTFSERRILYIGMIFLVNCSVLGWISIVVNDYSWEWNNCIICFLLL